MPIPQRFELSPLTEDLVQKMCQLCNEIEDALERGYDATELLKEWHHYATRTCEPHEFTAYWKSTDQEEFVREAIYPRPQFVEDLTYPEARDVLEAVRSAETGGAEGHYYLHWLEAQFPGSNISDLIYWPDEWFGNPALFREPNGAFKPEAELSSDQILGYAIERSKRLLPETASGIVLPYPLPES